jgi:hypothetical protein
MPDGQNATTGINIDMKTNKVAQATHDSKLSVAVEVLAEYGLQTHESATATSMGRETPFDARRVIMPVPSRPYYGAITIDLSATAVDKMLVAMFDLAYRTGLKDGERAAEERQAVALIEALPSLKGIIKEIADDVARERVEELRLDLA